MNIFRKSVQKVQVSLKCDKNTGTLHKEPCTFFKHISLNSSHNEKRFRQMSYRKSKKHILYPVTFPENCSSYKEKRFRQMSYRKSKKHILYPVTFPENCAVYEMMLKSVAKTDRQHTTMQYDARPLHSG
jgi:hypothetical protein